MEEIQACGGGSGAGDRHVTASLNASELDDRLGRDAGDAKNGTESENKAGDAASETGNGQLQGARKVGHARTDELPLCVLVCES